jgi:hypothetical protein
MEPVPVSRSRPVTGPTVEAPILGQFSSPPQYFGFVVEIDEDFCIIDTVIISTVSHYF